LVLARPSDLGFLGHFPVSVSQIQMNVSDSVGGGSVSQFPLGSLTATVIIY